MIYQMMCVYDSKARAFLLPFFCSHVDIGMRSFREAANKPGHQICEHAADFSLWHLGQYNDDNATFEFTKPSANLGPASQFKRAEIATEVNEGKN